MTLPIQNQPYRFYTGLVKQANPAEFQINPTIEAGDFQVSIDGGAFANLATLPTVSPAGSSTVQFDLTAAEMNGAKVNILGIDAAGNEWGEVLAAIDVPEGSIDSIYDLEIGDHTETSTRLIIKKAGTQTVLLDKNIAGSLLKADVTISTTDA